VDWKCWIVGGKTGPMATVRVFMWEEPFQPFGSGFNVIPEVLEQIGTIAHTTIDVHYQNATGTVSELFLTLHAGNTSFMNGGNHSQLGLHIMHCQKWLAIN
jgi:hypothetical protein